MGSECRTGARRGRVAQRVASGRAERAAFGSAPEAWGNMQPLAEASDRKPDRSTTACC